MLGTKKITTILQFTTGPTVGMCVNIIYFQDMMFSVFVVFFISGSFSPSFTVLYACQKSNRLLT